MEQFPLIDQYIHRLRAWDIKTYKVRPHEDGYDLVIELKHKTGNDVEKYFCIHKYENGRYLLTFCQELVWNVIHQCLTTIEEQKYYHHEEDVKERIQYLLRLQTY